MATAPSWMFPDRTVGINGEQIGSGRPKPPKRTSDKSGSRGANLLEPMTNDHRLKALKQLGYAVGDKWDMRAKAAWKNFMAANAQGKDPSKAATYWSRKSKLSTEYKPVAVTKAPPSSDVVTETPTATAPTDPNAAFAAMNQGSLQALAKMLAGLQAPKGTKLSPGLATMGMTPYGPELLDATTSGYDAQMSVLQRMIEQSGRDTAANIRQIGDWYGHVGKSLATAAERDKAIQAASLSSVTDAARSVASAIGGEANPGASMAAQAGAQGAGLVSAMGAANDEFNSDIAPLIQAEGVSRQAQERTAGGSRAQELALQLATLRGEKSGARGNAMLELAKLNNELKQQEGQNRIAIQQANAGVDQQDFQNKTGLFGLAMTLGQFGVDVSKLFMKPPGRAPKTPTPPSSSSLRQADVASIQSVAALRETGTLDVQSGVQAVKAAYGITAQSPKALRQAAMRSAQRAMPNVRINPDWFGL